VTKVASESVRIGGTQVRVAGAAKGSGMIAPNMATMLAFVTTDAAIGVPALRQAWRHAVVRSFNRVDVDQHMSTSDTALVLASGRSGNRQITGGRGYAQLAEALARVCESLARQIAADGEGATRQVTVRVKRAASAADARKAVRTITASPLVRCAFFGADPNWGRVISAVGYSGADFNWEQLACRMAGTWVFRHGRPVRFDRQKVQQAMTGKQWEVEVDLGVGDHEDWCYTCDLTHGYVTINAEYHT
jgi:glutamate N-acetyltransferase/amino-acid N-acetyltransferase